MRFSRLSWRLAAVCALGLAGISGCGGDGPPQEGARTFQMPGSAPESAPGAASSPAPTAEPAQLAANSSGPVPADRYFRGVDHPMPGPDSATPLGATTSATPRAAGEELEQLAKSTRGRFTLGRDKSDGRDQSDSDGQRESRFYDSADSMTDFNTEAYDAITENAFQRTIDQPLSTFSVDVDTASYANVRRFLNMGQLPPAGAVRIEELVNYFTYDDAPPTNAEPFAVHAETAGCPWNPAHRLVRFGLKGKVIENQKRPLSNLVFLLDVSGSMNEPNKLPLVKESLRLLTQQLGENDRVAIVVYAGASGLALPSISGKEQSAIGEALDRLAAGGSTNGGEGIALAYRVAEEHKIPGGVNRVILCTDGDFNVGVTNRSDLVQMVEQHAKAGVFLSVLGYGMGNLKDSTMEQLADKGNGNYAYIDTINEAKKVLVEQMSGTLVTIAKDVKIQIEFNPRMVAGYRLLGYENRMLAAQDFKDDTKDAGEIGAGHTVTALYELIPTGSDAGGVVAVDPLRYQQAAALTDAASSNEMLTLKLRYKHPDGQTSDEIRFTLKDTGLEFSRASANLRFAASVAAFGMLLRNSQHKGEATLPAVAEWAATAVGDDPNGYRQEFLELIHKAGTLQRVSMR